MSAWIKNLLRDAETVLQESSREDLASGIQKLREHPLVCEMQIFLHKEAEEVADKILDAESVEELQQCLMDVAHAFTASLCTIHLIRESGAATYHKKVVTTHSDRWAKQYVRGRFSSIDPIIQHCRNGGSSFFWDEILKSDPFTESYFSTAQRYGVGPNGFTVTHENKFGDLVAVSLASVMDHYRFRKAFACRQSDFEDVVPLLVEVYSELTGTGHQAGVSLTDDHLSVLHSLAMGTSIEEVMLGPFSYGSFHTIEKSILQALCARNLTQAVAIASELGILRNLPYFENEIVALVDRDRGPIQKHDERVPRPHDRGMS